AATDGARRMGNGYRWHAAGALGLALGLAAGTGPAKDRYEGYLCCNMRSDGSWISDSNYAEGGKRVIPAGTPVKVTGYGRYRVRVEIDGEKQATGNDYSRDLDDVMFARRYVVTDDVAARIASWPAAVREAVQQVQGGPGHDPRAGHRVAGLPDQQREPGPGFGPVALLAGQLRGIPAALRCTRPGEGHHHRSGHPQQGVGAQSSRGAAPPSPARHFRPGTQRGLHETATNRVRRRDPRLRRCAGPARPGPAAARDGRCPWAASARSR